MHSTLGSASIPLLLGADSLKGTTQDWIEAEIMEKIREISYLKFQS